MSAQVSPGDAERMRADRAAQLQSEMGLMTEEDLALLIGVKIDTLSVWRSEDMGPDFCKLGRSVFYRRHDVARWIEQNIKPTLNTKKM